MVFTDLELPGIHEEWMHIGGDIVYDEELHTVDGEEAERSRNFIKHYLHNYVLG